MNELKGKRRSKSTLKSVKHSLLSIEQKLNKPLEDCSVDELKKYFSSLNISASSLNLTQTQTIQFFKFVGDETDDVTYMNIARKLKKFRIERDDRVINPQDILSIEEVKKLINVATIERDRLLIASLFESGMRIGEICSLTLDMVTTDEIKQEVIFHIPQQPGCKTGARSVVCVDIFGYYQDWMKCNPTNFFMPLSQQGIRHCIKRLFTRAGIKKPCNVHHFRHSAITAAAASGMSDTQLSYRFWGIPHSNMLSIYTHLTMQMQAAGYKQSKGIDADEDKKNRLSQVCVNCGRLIQSGGLCKTCEDNTALKQKIAEMEQQRGNYEKMMMDMMEQRIEAKIKEMKKEV